VHCPRNVPSNSRPGKPLALTRNYWGGTPKVITTANAYFDYPSSPGITDSSKGIMDPNILISKE